MKGENGQVRIGVYICHCGVNIAATVKVAEVRDFIANQPNVVVARDYKFMCSDPGQELIKQDIKDLNVNRVVVAACSPLMHELTFRLAAESAGLNRYLVQIANIREHCSWVHDDAETATAKAIALVNAAVKRVALHEPLEITRSPLNKNALIVGGGIAGIQAALEISNAGHHVYLVEREPTIGGRMGTFDKTFPTLDCAACILTPKMVSVGSRDNITLLTYSEVESVSGYIGNFKIAVRKKAGYVDAEKCTGCGLCWSSCPAIRIPSGRAITTGGELVNEISTRPKD
ncbi:MAG: CoB--CoM heterodisulfide reductase iron-sulfur subunit A family protein [Ignavibacteria bacterium]|nr:CoB--CoM heterodisulfide reductase iron-sulfur subunit A family protein [Ignavibacteria bacterium]